MLSLNLKDGEVKRDLEIFPENQRIHKWTESPDLGRYFREFPLDDLELQVLGKAREVDHRAKSEKKNSAKAITSSEEEDEEEENELSEPNYYNVFKREMDELAIQLNDEGVFSPTEIADSRVRVLASIVRRRGQPAFRGNLLEAYNRRCAITGCEVEAVLEAAHIVPYKGEETNCIENGLLLRADLHTLFDLKLIVIDGSTMRLLVSNSLDGTSYEKYRGMFVRIPEDSNHRPSMKALEEHRKGSGL